MNFFKVEWKEVRMFIALKFTEQYRRHLWLSYSNMGFGQACQFCHVFVVSHCLVNPWEKWDLRLQHLQ